MAKKKKQKRKKFKIDLVDEFDDEDFFDDCPVCQAIKFAQQRRRTPTLSELKKAFKKAKEISWQGFATSYTYLPDKIG